MNKTLTSLPETEATLSADKVTKLTVNLPTSVVNQLKQHADSKRITATEWIRRALETVLFLEEEQTKDKKLKVVIEKKNGDRLLLMRK